MISTHKDVPSGKTDGTSIIYGRLFFAALGQQCVSNDTQDQSAGDGSQSHLAEGDGQSDADTTHDAVGDGSQEGNEGIEEGDQNAQQWW